MKNFKLCLKVSLNLVYMVMGYFYFENCKCLHININLAINLHKNVGWFTLMIQTKFLSVKTITPTSATLVDWESSMSRWTTPEIIQIGILRR